MKKKIKNKKTGAGCITNLVFRQSRYSVSLLIYNKQWIVRVVYTYSCGTKPPVAKRKCAVMKLNGKQCDLSYVEYDTSSFTNTNDSCLHRPYSLFQKILANNERAITSNI